jgi:hypothetical protein
MYGPSSRPCRPGYTSSIHFGPVDDITSPVSGAGASAHPRTSAPPNTHIFYIYYIAILQKYIVRHKFCNSIHLPPCPRRQGYNAVSHGGRSRQEWARLGAIRHGVRGLAPWATTTAGLLAPWATTLESGCLSNTEIQPKMS